MKNTLEPLNKTQIEILKLFTQPMSEDELKEIKLLLTKYLSKRLTNKVSEITEIKGYTQENFDSWLNDPNQ